MNPYPLHRFVVTFWGRSWFTCTTGAFSRSHFGRVHPCKEALDQGRRKGPPNQTANQPHPPTQQPTMKQSKQPSYQPMMEAKHKHKNRPLAMDHSPSINPYQPKKVRKPSLDSISMLQLQKINAPNSKHLTHCFSFSPVFTPNVSRVLFSAGHILRDRSSHLDLTTGRRTSWQPPAAGASRTASALRIVHHTLRRNMCVYM